ncbi:MAG: 16S rRNA (guanine(527)-N(7))-methyltransferase RsmG [Phycisphaerae bacterium]|nr:16S rRNA (guanine(527)-N(7))-methyltransferase RsmG [Phycisphaerae bacterium]
MTLTNEQSAFLHRCGVNPAHLDLDVMVRLFDDLITINQRMNLTRITSSKEFWNLHILDSLSVGVALPEIMAASLRAADVGCGAGFPLLPLGWANPKLEITGIESRGRKVEFIRAEIDSLKLANVRVVHAQAREAARKEQFAGRFDVVLLRAVGQAGKMLRECRSLLKPTPEAKIIFYKTPAAVKAERPEAQREAAKFHLELTESSAFSLPAGAGERQFLIFTRK